MSESLLPQPPQDEFDEDGRHVHPYVRNPDPDPSVFGYTTLKGSEWTEEDRSRESRLAFHAIEPLLGALSPWGMAHLIKALCFRLHDFAETPELTEGRDEEEIDPRNESLPFLDLHRTRLWTLSKVIDEVLNVCPRCGRNHGENAHDEEILQPGAYVHAQTGDAVRVSRVEQERVYCTAQVSDTGREVARIYDRPWFDENFVPADQVEVLGGPVA